MRLGWELVDDNIGENSSIVGDVSGLRFSVANLDLPKKKRFPFLNQHLDPFGVRSCEVPII